MSMVLDSLRLQYKEMKHLDVQVFLSLLVFSEYLVELKGTENKQKFKQKSKKNCDVNNKSFN